MKKPLINKKAYEAPLTDAFLLEQLQCICASMKGVNEENSGIDQWNP